MLFILPGILLIGFICIAFWALFFRATLRYERGVRAARQRSIDFEKRLATLGELLYCLSCRETFVGPLAAKGCPHCNISAFVIPASASDDPAIAQQAIPQSCPPSEAVPPATPLQQGTQKL